MARNFVSPDDHPGNLAVAAQRLADQAQAELDEPIEQHEYAFRSTVTSERNGDVLGSGPVTEWADREDVARRQAVAFERETFGAPRANVNLILVSVDGLDVFDGPEVLTRIPGGPR